MDALSADALDLLGSPSRSNFLAHLVFELSIAARTFYAEADNEVEDAVKGLRGCNECFHVLGNQLLADVSSGDAYPDDAFVESFLERAGPASQAVRYAVRRAITESA